eukprot:IDg6909t1
MKTYSLMKDFGTANAVMDRIGRDRVNLENLSRITKMYRFLLDERSKEPNRSIATLSSGQEWEQPHGCLVLAQPCVRKPVYNARGREPFDAGIPGNVFAQRHLSGICGTPIRGRPRRTAFCYRLVCPGELVYKACHCLAPLEARRWGLMTFQREGGRRQ